MYIESALNVQVANWSVLYTKLHNYHWYVKGPLFFTLHEKFEELYNEAGEIVDELAERILALGGKPAATLSEYLHLATIEEAVKDVSAEDMVNSLIQDYRQLKAELKKLIDLASDEKDDVTEDMAIALVEKIDTHVWMLSALLNH
ncbi:Dps family protein [Heyndrickxia ginsengihumi]|uniref:DNA starvation/stationary phase protection protein n=1 Tax=Heyndrickxia ginsengihumi TaxID=363870 RepID=A0A0A6V9H4_9BACI|nr:DNA starvation/stationary phase protection protein [Heyndrickxia ginsengihumi]KHD84231.1 general stress protein [Heyndrickxia ginsengihumi]MBE6183605.1 DNA starvation/stationary phase protection protein [Bacillus sp. (in: firmicutes)]MCM3024965.1 DNA starvation/stationary phase protection protein [Heyndrickxia ginsengihumi]NEY18748.1 DNA starvation/stationary phase protection protein [Heyndrickxia ginsengihumi]